MVPAARSVNMHGKGQFVRQAVTQFLIHAEAGQVENAETGGHAIFDAPMLAVFNGPGQADIALPQRVFKKQPEHAPRIVDERADGQLLVRGG